MLHMGRVTPSGCSTLNPTYDPSAVLAMQEDDRPGSASLYSSVGRKNVYSRQAPGEEKFRQVPGKKMCRQVPGEEKCR